MRASVAPLLIAVTLLVGCGSERQPWQSGGQNAKLGGAAGFKPYQPRDSLLKCLKKKGVDAIAIGQDTLQVLPLPDAPRVVMAADPEAATAMQVRGKAEGAQLMGLALVYADRSSDRQVREVQDCL